MSTPSRIPLPERNKQATGKRVNASALLSLAELDPQQVVEGVRVDSGLETDDVTCAGTMREKCPYCHDVALQLVLRYGNVIRPHLFCETCTRCFDARYPDGCSALVFAELPID